MLSAHLHRVRDIHDRAFASLEQRTDGWFLGLFARFVFASVLLVFFLNAGMTKIGDEGIFSISDGAYIQILPTVFEEYGYDSSEIPTVPWGLIVAAGTWAEFILPVLVVLGLFTRLAALGMIGFVAVQTWVDISFHHADATTVGAMFDRISNSLIADQRLLWLFPLVYLVVKGAGALSADALLARLRRSAG